MKWNLSVPPNEKRNLLSCPKQWWMEKVEILKRISIYHTKILPSGTGYARFSSPRPLSRPYFFLWFFLIYIYFFSYFWLIFVVFIYFIFSVITCKMFRRRYLNLNILGYDFTTIKSLILNFAIGWVESMKSHLKNLEFIWWYIKRKKMERSWIWVSQRVVFFFFEL